MRAPIIAVVLLALGPATSAAQSAEDSEERVWSLSATVAVYGLPDEDDYAQPMFSADRGALHLETRYNYEALRTASLIASRKRIRPSKSPPHLSSRLFASGERKEWMR